MRGLPSSFSVWASHCAGFSSCKAWARGAWHQRLQLTGCKHGLSSCVWHMHLVALRHVESSWTRDQTHVPCIGRQILIHCTTREVQVQFPAHFLVIPRPLTEQPNPNPWLQQNHCSRDSPLFTSSPELSSAPHLKFQLDSPGYCRLNLLPHSSVSLFSVM